VTPQLRIGCSGWNYKSWKGRFYGPAIPASRWLRHYATVFDTVEVNNTFYRLPEADTFAAWRAQTPASFLMAVKASRFLTHMKRLRDPAEPLDRLFSRARSLGSRLGPVLYQLPANFHLDLERLEQFLDALPSQLRVPAKQGSATVRLRHVLEFRHPSWYVPATFELLERRSAALCLHDKAGSTIDRPFAGPFVYVRFHGPTGDYHGSYTPQVLQVWAHRLAEQAARGRDVFAYFNNDPDAIATENARSLKAHLTALTCTPR